MQRGGSIMNPPRIANIVLYSLRFLRISAKPLSYRQDLAYHAICSVHLQHYGVERCCFGQQDAHVAPVCIVLWNIVLIVQQSVVHGVASV